MRCNINKKERQGRCLDNFNYDGNTEDSEQGRQDVVLSDEYYEDYSGQGDTGNPLDDLDYEDYGEIEEKAPKVKEKVVKVTELPEDYTRIIAFAGAGSTGTTSLCIMTANRLASKDRKVALLDLTENRDLYEMFIFERAYYKDDLRNPLIDLSSGISKPVSIKKGLDLFTASNTSDIYYDINTMIETLRLDYNIIICDMDINSNLEATRVMSQIYLVQDMDWTNYKYITRYQEKLIGINNPKKIKYVVNKYRNTVKSRIVTDCMITSVDIDTMDRYNIMEEKPVTFLVNYDTSWGKMFDRNELRYEGLGRNTKKQLDRLVGDVYPVRKRIFGK